MTERVGGLSRRGEGSSLLLMLIMSGTLGLTAILGSYMSGVALAAAAVVFIRWMLHPGRLAFNKRELRIVLVFASYFVVTLVFAMAHENRVEGLRSLVKLLPFVAVIPLMPTLRRAYRPYWGTWIERGFMAGGMLCGTAAIVFHLFYPDERMEGLAGNPLIYASLSSILTIVNLILAGDGAARRRMLFLTASALSLTAVVFSNSRWPLILLVVVSGFLFVSLIWDAYRRREVGVVKYLLLYTGALVVALVGLHGTGALAPVEARFERLRHALVSGPSASDEDNSLLQRRRLMIGGWAAFKDRPLTGHGRQNAVDAADAYFNEKPRYRFTHLHNAYLTDAVASGILGLLAYCAMLATPLIAAAGLNKRYRRVAFFVALLVAGDGLANIGFYHDITATYFAVFVCVLACLPREDETSVPRSPHAAS